MDKLTLTITGATMAELRASAAEFAQIGVTAGITNFPQPGPDDADDTAPLNVNAPAVDGDGVPWDDRIHSSNKQMTDKGVWRRKRGIQDSDHSRITAELKARGTVQAGVNAVTAAAPPAMPPMTPPGYPPVPQGAIPASPPMTAPAPAPAPIPQPAPVAGMGFGDFMAKYTNAVNTGICTPDDLQSYLSASGVASVGLLNNDPAMTLKIHDWMVGNGKL